MGRAAVTIALSATEGRELESLARRRRTAQGLARRARIILADELGDGAGLEVGQALELAVDTSTGRLTVRICCVGVMSSRW